MTQSLQSYFEIIYKTELNTIDFRNLTTTSQLYGAKLDFIVEKFTSNLYEQGYAPLKKGLIVQKRAKSIRCPFYDVLRFDVGFCVDPSIEDKSPIKVEDNSTMNAAPSENVYSSSYGFEG